MFKILLLILTLSLTLSSSLVIERTFDDIELDLSDNVALFYRTGMYGSLDAYNAFEKVADVLNSMKLFNLKFYTCDGDLEINKNLFVEAGFDTDRIHIFFQVNKHVEIYSGDLTVDGIVAYAQTLYVPITKPELVNKFESSTKFFDGMKEASSNAAFVKFVINDCKPCDALVVPFQRYAQHFTKVNFFEVNCDGTAEERSFCNDAGVNSYPTLISFNGGARRVYAEPDRTFTSVERFLKGIDSFLVEKTFDEIEEDLFDNVAIFYNSENPESETALTEVEKFARILSKERTMFSFYKCDGEKNGETFQVAGFEPSKIYVFFQHNKDVEIFSGEMKSEAMLAYARHLFIPVTQPELVHSFTNEVEFYDRLSVRAKPTLVKYVIDVCDPCVTFANTFKRYAQHFTSVDFVEVNCGDNGSKSFCTDSGVSTYPSMILFNGDDKITYAGVDRSFHSVEKFLNEHTTIAVSVTSA